LENKQLKCLCALALTVGISSKLNDHVVLANPNGSNEVSSSNLASGVVTADALNVRSDASTSSRIIGVLHKDSKVTILESRNGWHKVKINSGEGWIFGEYVKIQGGSQVASSQLGEVNANSLNVRSGAGTSHGIIGSLSQGASVNIITVLLGLLVVTMLQLKPVMVLQDQAVEMVILLLPKKNLVL